jgi:hypothetical protein
MTNILGKIKGYLITLGYFIYGISLAVLGIVALIIFSEPLGLLDGDDKPWIEVATDRESGLTTYRRQNYEFQRHATYEKCLEQLSWDVSNEFSTELRKPIACGYTSNSKFKAISALYSSPDARSFACLIKNKNPKSETENNRYLLVPKSLAEFCVNDKKVELIVNRNDPKAWIVAIQSFF